MTRWSLNPACSYETSHTILSIFRNAIRVTNLNYTIDGYNFVLNSADLNDLGIYLVTYQLTIEDYTYDTTSLTEPLIDRFFLYVE